MKTPRETIKGILQKVTGAEAEVTVPEFETQGHFSTNIALRLAKERKKSPLLLAEELAPEIYASYPELFQRVEVAPPGFINMWLTHEAHRASLAYIVKTGKKFGSGTTGKGKTVIVEYSQPNIAKRMHVGHLRTTILGDVLANLFEASGYKVIRWNYLGDWGTQFGKLIAAYKKWGKKEAVEAAPIETLQKLYVKFHDEMKSDESLEKTGQAEFKKLEEGDKENRALWEWFKKESLKEFNRIYKMLGVSFDTEIGESFYEKDIAPLVEELKKKGLAKESEGALVVSLESEGLPPALVQKSDGASLYLTRDIANIRYRLKTYKPEKILYVVGNEQSLHFAQLFAVAKRLGLDGAELTHVKYGLVLGEEGKKLATREGRTVLLDDVVQKALEEAQRIVSEKRPELTNKEKSEIAEVVALGALKYSTLKEGRTSDITFNWEKMLDFSGDSAPYLQYTYARLKSIIEKAGRLKAKPDFSLMGAAEELALIRAMGSFPHAVLESAKMLQTNALALYLYNLANAANKFYETTPIVKDPEKARVAARLVLIRTATETLAKGLALLGIRVLEKI